MNLQFAIFPTENSEVGNRLSKLKTLNHPPLLAPVPTASSSSPGPHCPLPQPLTTHSTARQGGALQHSKMPLAGKEPTADCLVSTPTPRTDYSQTCHPEWRWSHRLPPSSAQEDYQESSNPNKTTPPATRGSRLPCPPWEGVTARPGPLRATEIYLRGPAPRGCPSCRSRYRRPAGPRRRPPPGEAPRRSLGCGSRHMLRARSLALRGQRPRTGGNPREWASGKPLPARALRPFPLSTLPGARRLPLL
jgi:hypothetical protein